MLLARHQHDCKPGSLQGGHLNPALTLGTVVTGHMDWVRSGSAPLDLGSTHSCLGRDGGPRVPTGSDIALNSSHLCRMGISPSVAVWRSIA